MSKNTRPRTILDSAATVIDVCQRELGLLSTRNFEYRRRASQDLVLRLDSYKKLDKHRGCVNTLSFNADVDILVSGSDDRRAILWDWVTGRIKLSFDSGHYDDVTQAKIMPFSDDRSIVTCAINGEEKRKFLYCHVNPSGKDCARFQMGIRIAAKY
ncbi:DDB1- and CUL4-associated factor 8-like [Mangifera indica]|uniref:DDB1- and CUL4-associated factor 8-like n=1 Tax=Mangifera indica TaxID=29780 RepID=UPI001CFA2D60|nr:DDB1- and CUL4-associated factor 8-like [Mangifera indica]XP_044481542.1 DDB1- and CUL4-associated factor 8-like [Mangifera indica]